MRKLFSFLLGGALLIGALGLQAGTASAAGRRHRHHRHHRHYRYRRNRLSY